MKQIIKDFRNVYDLHRYVSNLQTGKTFANHSLSSQGNGSFYATESLESSLNMLLYGDAKNAEKINKKLDDVRRIHGSGIAKKKIFANDVVGYAVHVPNYLSGVPLSMINNKTQMVKSSKVLNIVYNGTFSSKEKHEDVINAGVKVIEYLQNMERKGYRINLYSILCSKADKETISVIVRIKDAEQYMNLKKVVYPMVNPDFTRRIMFRIIEGECSDKKYINGYGRPVLREYEMKDVLSTLKFKVDRYLSYYEVKETDKIQ